MKSIIKSTFTGLCALLLASSCSSTPATDTPATRPSGMVTIEGVSAAYTGAAATGKGTLTYQGRIHHFTMTGLGVGGTGVQKVSAGGEVHNLHRLENFAGTYKGTSKGLTLINGKMKSKMTNEHGVVVYLSGKRQGLASSGGVRAFKVKLVD